MTEIRMSTPCIKDCRQVDGVCMGCGRTVRQIAEWTMMTEDERFQVMLELTKREPGAALWKCNACGKFVIRKLGWKIWTKSFCEETGRDARIYRVSAPTEQGEHERSL